MRAKSIQFAILLAIAFIVQSAIAANPPVTINVDGTANRHPIDPKIYGVSFASGATVTDLGITLNRWGGNRVTRYNWQTHHGNTAADFFFENLDEAGAFGFRHCRRLHQCHARSQCRAGDDDSRVSARISIPTDAAT